MLRSIRAGAIGWAAALVCIAIAAALSWGCTTSGGAPGGGGSGGSAWSPDNTSSGGGCVNTCSSNKCSSSGTLQQCIQQTNGCRAYAAGTACPAGQVCPFGEGACRPCSENAECLGNEVCKAGSCTNASGLAYRFTFVSATVPEKDENGASWDGFGGLPDTFACLYINCGPETCAESAKIGCTSASHDTTKAFWAESIDATVYATDEVTVLLFDADFSAHDWMSGVSFGDTVGLLHDGGMSGALPDTAFSLTFWVDAK